MAKKEEQFWIGVCTECHSDQPGKYMENSPFEQPPCKMCGGVTIVVPADKPAARKAALDRADTSRGIYRAPEQPR